MRSLDFERLLRTRPCARSQHFALHHLREPETRELSTDGALKRFDSVDDFRATIGVVVPKRHARRAVTRSLIKRQARAALCRHRRSLQAGLWVVRLRSPFEPRGFASAASANLSTAARLELDALFGALA